MERLAPPSMATGVLGIIRGRRGGRGRTLRRIRLPEGGKRSLERGGITILVALTLLGLLTLGAFGLSRGAIRELMVAGTLRQGIQVSLVADSGIAWAQQAFQAGPAGGDPAAQLLAQAIAQLEADPGRLGITCRIPVPGGAPRTFCDGSLGQYDIDLTAMGLVSPVMTSSLPGGIQAGLGGREAGVQVVWRAESRAEVVSPGGMVFRRIGQGWFLDAPRR